MKNALCKDRCQNVHSLSELYTSISNLHATFGSWILQRGFPLGPTSPDRHTVGSLLVNVTGTFAVVLC